MVKHAAPAVGDPFIRARGLSLKVPLGTAYENVDLDIPFGQFCSVVANSGEGKTELLLTLAGRMKPTAGTLEVGGWRLPAQRSRVCRVSGMGFFDLVNDVQPVLTVGSVVAAELNLYSKRSGRKAVEAYLDEWGLRGVARTKIESLDRTSYVRLGVALGLAGDPWLLVVDDVESELTRLQSVEVMKELAGVAHGRGVTVVVACTDYELALEADATVPISDAAREQARVHASNNAQVEHESHVTMANEMAGEEADHA